MIRPLTLSFVIAILSPPQELQDLNFDEFITSYSPVALNYSNVLFGSTSKDYRYTDDDKTAINRILNHTKTCSNFYNHLSSGEVSKMDLIAKKFFHEILRLNKKFIQITTKKITDDYYVNYLTDDIKSTSKLIESLDDFMYTMIDGRNLSSLSGLLRNMADFDGNETVSLLGKKHNGLKLYQQIIKTHKCLSMSFMNGYAILFDSFNMFRLHNITDSLTDDFESLIVLTRKKLRRTLTQIAEVSRGFLKNTSVRIGRGDPPIYTEGVNFEQLNRFFHAHIISKPALANKQSCDFSACSSYQRAVLPDDSLHRFQCNGSLHDCWSTTARHICFPENPNGTRAYQAFRSSNDMTFGPWTNLCQGTNVVDTAPLVKDMQETWTYNILNFSIKTFINCEMCVCTCDDYKNTKTVRRFSLRQVRSKFSQGVVTGVRMHVENKVIVLKIRVGLLKNGVVDPREQSWNKSYVAQLDPDSSFNETQESILQDDSHDGPTVSMSYSYRNILTGDVSVPDGSVVQGVKFVACREGVSVAVLGTRIDVNGRLVPGTATWYSDCSSSGFTRKKVEMPEYPDVPTKTNETNQMLSGPNSYVQFQTTDWKADGSQTTIPFLDTQRIMVNPPTPLARVGLHFKSHSKSGGFIVVQLATFNFLHFFSNSVVNRTLENCGI